MGSDIIYLPLVGGAIWLPGAMLVRVMSWHLRPADAHRASLMALEQGLTLRQPPPGLIIRADQGRQFTSAACQQRITDTGGLPSFSRPGNPYDNAQAEAGWNTHETELLPLREPFTSLEEARL